MFLGVFSSLDACIAPSTVRTGDANELHACVTVHTGWMRREGGREGGRGGGEELASRMVV